MFKTYIVGTGMATVGLAINLMYGEPWSSLSTRGQIGTALSVAGVVLMWGYIASGGPRKT